MKNAINIAFGATEDWLKYTQVTLYSILENRNKQDFYKIYIMCNCSKKIFTENFKKFFSIPNVEINFLKMNDSEFEGCIHDWLGVSSSYRLKLSSLINEDKILYLDSDIVVVQDIATLYNQDIQNYYIAAVEDKLSDIMKPRVKLSSYQKYINGGVQLINLKKWRDFNLEKLIFDKLREFDFYTDQDVVNDVCRDKIKLLPIKYNVMPIGTYGGCKEFFEACKNPFCIHYTQKPWDANTALGEYWHHYNQALSSL